MIIPPCTKRAPGRHGLPRLMQKNSSVPNRALTSTPSTHLWNELESRLHPEPSRPTSLPELTKALRAERAQIPTATLRSLSSEIIIAAKERQAHMGVMIRCAQTFGHIVENSVFYYKVIMLLKHKVKKKKRQLHWA